MLYNIRSFDKLVDTALFQSGQPLLDQYIQRYASQDLKRQVSRVFIATPTNNTTQLAGFFTLSAGSIRCSDLPNSLAKKIAALPYTCGIDWSISSRLPFSR